MSSNAVRLKAQHLPRWVIPVFIAAAILAAAFVYLWPSPIEFPMDDAYIHFVYAENLAERGQLFFSFPDEKGVATSSFLWVVLLAVGDALGIPVQLLAKVLGVASLITIAIGVYLLLRPIWTPLRAAAAALLLSLSGNMLWFSLNGMETTLLPRPRDPDPPFASLRTLGLVQFSRRAPHANAPQGTFLLAAIGLAELAAHRRLRREFWLAAAIGLLLIAPWYGYLKLRTGHFLPTSASAKQFGSAVATDFLLQQYDLPEFLGQFSNLMYPAMWIAYLLEFGLGGMALPPPKFRMAGMVGSPGVDISIWAFPAAAMVIWLLYLAGTRFFKLKKWKIWVGDPHRRALLVLFFWVVLHNLAYMILLPIPGTASRYGAVNYIILWIGIVGFFEFAKISQRRWAVGLFLLVIVVANGLYWNWVYDTNIEHMLHA